LFSTGVDINVLITERVVATVYCTGDSIVEFVTSSPLYMNKTTVAPVGGTTNQFYITLTWTPIADQWGPQVFFEKFLLLLFYFCSALGLLCCSNR
jgi:hypothetical protein